MAKQTKRLERRLGLRSSEGDSPARSVAQRAFVPSRRRVPARFDSSSSRALSHTVRIAAMRGIQRARRPVHRTRSCAPRVPSMINVQLEPVLLGDHGVCRFLRFRIPPSSAGKSTVFGGLFLKGWRRARKCMEGEGKSGKITYTLQHVGST